MAGSSGIWGKTGGSMGLEQCQGMIEIASGGQGFIAIDHEINRWLRKQRARDGLLVLFIRHSSASLLIQENADPSVLADLADALDKMAPQNASYRHASEGPDDMPAHIKCMLTPTSLTIPVSRGEMALGSWQGVFVAEHRTRPRRRQIILHFIGELNTGSSGR